MPLNYKHAHVAAGILKSSPSCNIDQSQQYVQHGGFARAGASANADLLPSANAEVQASQNLTA